MAVTLDGQNLFDTHQLDIELGSTQRDSIERSVTGLDGVLSIDLGGRGRVIKQKGVLTAKSKTVMDQRINAISAFMDGDTHKLVTNTGDQFDTLRMDAFKISKERAGGAGLVVDYEIIYTQLAV